MDVVKTYDRVNWNFLRLILLQIGLPISVTNGIMACISSTQFVVLVNDSPTIFFKSSKGLCDGFPLPPLLFLLVIEGLSRLINLYKSEGKLKGIKISLTVFISHLLFVDDVMLFGKGSKEEWQNFVDIIKILCVTSSMDPFP